MRTREVTARPQGKATADSKREGPERSVHFPDSAKLEALLATYDRQIGYFELAMERRHARALRRVLFGSNGLNEVPEGKGMIEFELRRGWTLRLRYAAKPPGFDKAGAVTAEFIPPPPRPTGSRHRRL